MERNTPRQPLILEVFVKWLLAKARENRLPLLSTFLFGALAHMFAFTNKLVNHDEVNTLFFKGGTFPLGRWGLALLDRIFPDYSMPWIYGVLTIFLIAIAVCLMVHIFRLRNPLLQILLSGVIITFPTLTGTLTYMFTSSSYAVSLLLSVLAVFFLQTPSKKFIFLSLGCMIASLSIYQSYIALAASLLVVLLIQQLLQGETVRTVIRRGFCFVGFLASSLGLYYIATRLVNHLKHTGFDGYASSSMSFSLLSLPTDIADAYRTFLQYFTEGYRGLIPTLFSRNLHYLLLITMAVLLLAWFFTQTKRDFPRLLLLIALIAVLPLAINCMHLFATVDAVHTLVLYSFVCVYILGILLTDACLPLLPTASFFKLCKTLSLNLLTLALSAIIVANTYIANEAYLTLYLRYENAYAFYTSLFADLKMMPEFDEDSKLALVGTFQEPAFYLEKFYFSDSITGTDGFLPDVYSKDRFMEYYIGYPLTFASDAEVAAIAQTDEYQQMATYPYYGSIRVIGDTIVVKLS